MFLQYSNATVAAFYIAANVVCLLLFGVILYKNVTGIDRQVKSRFFDYVLLSHMAYYVIDIIWALFYFEVIPNYTGLQVCNIFIVLFASTVACVWYIYIEALQNNNVVKSLKNRLLIYLPVILVTIVDAIITASGNGYRIEPNGKVVGEWWYILFMLCPVTYVLLAFLKGIFRSLRKENKAFKKEYVMIASYPLSILVFGIIQIALMNSGITLPILSYGTTVSMIFVYVSSLDNLISLDPLTELNNRSELTKHLYSSFRNIQFEDNLFVIMLDIDKFKNINDNYGHVEGDKALQRLAKCLKNACYSKENEVFLARYGGDEFIIVAKLVNPFEIKKFEQNIINEIEKNAQPANNEYHLTVTMGISRYSKNDTVDDLIKRADKVLYENKRKRDEKTGNNR